MNSFRKTPGEQESRRGRAVAATGNPGCRQMDRARFSAFTLIEIMVAMALMSVIVIGLMAMFNETQRAFRLGTTQTDVLEAGRMATDLIGRELAQVTPANVDYKVLAVPNFSVDGIKFSTQSLPGTAVLRTNVLQDLFFLSRENQTWTGIGYFVRTNLGAMPATMGTLYRFQDEASVSQFQQDPGVLYNEFNRARQGLDFTNVSKVLDGVVNFRIRAYSTNGFWIGGDPRAGNYSTPKGSIYASYSTAPLAGADEVERYLFMSNAVPVSAEFELGVLEQQTLDQMRSIPNATAQAKFLFNQANHVHLFRQQIRIRNADLSAYQGFQ